MLYGERVRESLYTLDFWAIPKSLHTFLPVFYFYSIKIKLSVCIYIHIYTHIYNHTQDTHTYIYAHIYIMHMYAYCCSLPKSCLTLCDPMDCSTPGFPALLHLLAFAQTHVCWVLMSPNHLILCHPLLLLPSSFPVSGSSPMTWLFASAKSCIGQSVGASTSASVFPLNIQGWFPLGLTGLISL